MQARTLSIMGRDKAEVVAEYVNKINRENVDIIESTAAKEYFSDYHEGLNRRAIARSLVSVGFHPTFGIHHDSQLNAFNLADDLIELYRAIVDLLTNENIGSNVKLSKNERKEIAHVLHNACMVDGVKVNVLTAIDLMCESLKRIILDKSDENLKLPIVFL